MIIDLRHVELLTGIITGSLFWVGFYEFYVFPVLKKKGVLV